MRDVAKGRQTGGDGGGRDGGHWYGRAIARPYMLLFFLLAACAAPPAAAPTAAPAPVEITVFAAASLTDAFAEIGQQFSAANPAVTVTFNMAGSQQLAAQLAQGAPADVFASANTAQMTAAVDAGRVAADAPQPFVSNSLVVITPPDSTSVTTLPDLAKPGVRVVIAAPAVPAGQYALTFLDNAAQDSAFTAAFRTQVEANIVSYEENVRAVLAKVALGEADAGIVYISDVVSSDERPVVSIPIPATLNVVARYPIAPISDAPHPEAAQQFIDYVLSPPAQAILARYGFGAP